METVKKVSFSATALAASLFCVIPHGAGMDGQPPKKRLVQTGHQALQARQVARALR